MQKARFFSVVLLLLLASLFVTRFSFYPLLRSYLELRYDVRLDIERTEICGFACLSIPTLTVERPGVFRLSAEGVTVAAGVRHSGAFGLAPVISRWEVSRAEVTVQDPAALMDDTDGPFLKDGLPPFPFGRIALERIAARIRIGAGELRLSDMTLDGDGRYTLTIPEASYTHPRLRKPFLAAGKTVFRAAGTAYALETIESTGNGLAFTGTAGAHTFRGTAHLQLDRILDQFDERRSSGDISVKFDASWQDGDPTLTADLRADRLGWDTFRIHDIAARLVADQRGLTVERLLLFDRGTPVLSLGGTMEWHEPTLRGTAHLWALDFRDTMERFGAPCWVDMWFTGTIAYAFSFRTLVADYTTDLAVRGLGVHTDDRFAILELADPYLVAGRGQIRPDRVVLSSAEVRLRDDTTHLFLHDSWFDFTDSFQILISPSSWIDLDRVRAIAELATTGRGAIDVSITSKYEHPRIVGHFAGNDCSVAGFDTERCDLTIELKDFVLSFLGNSLAYRSIRTEGSRVAIDFNKEPVLVSFLFSQVNGMVPDIGGVLRTQLPDLGGRFSFTAEGRYAGRLTSLVGTAQADKAQWRGMYLADRVSFSFADDGDLLRLTKGSVARGDSRFSLSGTMDRRTFLLDMQATLDAFFTKDFPFLSDIVFSAPRITVAASGPLTEPHIEADAFFGGVSYQGVAMGNFAGHLAYDATSGRIDTSGNLGEAVSFRGDLQGLDIGTMNAAIKVRDFTHKKGDLFFKTSLDAHFAEGEVDARIGKLIVEKRGIFVRNAQPFHVKGRWEELAIDPVVFDGETVNGTVTGTLRKGRPYLEAAGTIFPAALGAFAGTPALGDISGNASFKMTVADEALSGDIALHEIGCTLLPYDLPVKRLDGVISFHDGAWRVGSLTGMLGGGKLELNGSGAFSPEWSGQGKIAITNATARHRVIGPLSFSAYLDISAEKGETPSVSGEVEFKNINYRNDFSLVNAVTKTLSGGGTADGSAGHEPGRSDPRLNLRVTGRNALRVSNNVLNADLVLDTRISGTLSRPAIDGTLQLTAGELTFKQNRFTLDRGIVTVEPGDRVRPYLDIRGTTRIYARSKQTEYKLVLTVTGYADDPAIRVSSMPQLEETEAYSLLLWGDFFDPGQPGVENLALVAVTDIFGISDEVKKNFRLSRFELTPRYSDIDYKTVLKIVAVKEIYPFLIMSVESNPADPADQMFGLTYRGSNFDLSLDWKYKNKLETDYGGVGVNFMLNYLFE